MDLKDKFSNAQESADFSKLHTIIDGPFCSGKTTIAVEYINDLVRKGLVPNHVVRLDCASDLNTPLDQSFKSAERGVLLLDNITYWQPGIDELAAPLVQAAARNSCVILLVGDTKGIERFLQDNDGVANVFSRTVTTQRSFSLLEREKFNETKAPRRRF